MWTLCFAVIALAACGSGGSSADSGRTGNDDGNTGGSGRTITGRVVVGVSDLAAPSVRAVAHKGEARRASSADSALTNAQVTLVKIKADGAEETVSGVTATTDGNGNFTLTGVPDAVSGTGASTDYYYEIRASSNGIEVSAPAAPTSDETVTVSPESKIAAAMLSTVASVPSASSASVLPSVKAIGLLRDIVATNIGELTTFTLPPMDADDDSKVIIAATAVASNNGNAEKLLRAYEALKEGLYLRTNADTVSDRTVAGFLDRMTRAACDFQGTKLPQAASNAVAEAFKSGMTYSLDAVVAAYNDNGGNPQASAGGLITTFNNILAGLNTAQTSTAELSDSEVLAIYASNGALSRLSATARVTVDQALLLLQIVSPENQRCHAPLNYVGIIAELTGNATLATTPAFADIELYHQRLQCPEGSLETRVKVYAPQGTDVSNITIFSAGLKDQNGVDIASSVSLTYDTYPSPGTSNWMLSGGSTQVCLAFGLTYTFTISAGLSTGATLTTTVSRAIVDVPEARITLIAKDYAETGVVFSQSSTGQPNSPIKLTAALSTERPIFKWSPDPGDAAAIIPTAPAGAKIKYLYDVSHFAMEPGGGGGPENRDFTNCQVAQANNKFFDKDYILSPIDCDVDACNAALPDKLHVCRIHVQTVLVDEADRTLGWSAGADLYYCIEGQTNCP
jgi:hypothetical protein